MMRTTIDLPEKLHRVALGLSRHTGRSLSQTVVMLMERGLNEVAPVAAANAPLDALTGLPVVRSQRAITADDVKALDNDG